MRRRLLYLLLLALPFVAMPSQAGVTTVTGELIWPSQNDINGGVAGNGKTMLESQWVKLAQAFTYENFTISSGFTQLGGLSVQVNAGSAYVGGRYVEWPNTTITVQPNLISVIFVVVRSTSGLATGLDIEDRTDGFEPSDPAVCIGRISANATTVTTASTGGSFTTRNRRWMNVNRFTANDFFTVPYGASSVTVFLKGGGGGGGGGGGSGGGDTNKGTNTYSAPGSLGGRGGDGQDVVTSLPVVGGETLSITIGAGGSGGSGGSGGAAAANGSNGGNGSQGGTTTITGAFSASALGGNGGSGGRQGFVAGAGNLYSSYGIPAQPQTNAGQGGVPGAGGDGVSNGDANPGNAGNAGSTGSAGYAVIMW